SAHSCHTRSGDASNSASTVMVSVCGVPADGGKQSLVLRLRFGDELGHTVDAAAPQLLVLIEQATRDAQLLEIGADHLAAPDALFGNQASPLEDGDVLLDGREAHRVVAGEFDDALLGSDRAAHDVPTSVIGESAKHLVKVVRPDLH